MRSDGFDYNPGSLSLEHGSSANVAVNQEEVTWRHSNGELRFALQITAYPQGERLIWPATLELPTPHLIAINALPNVSMIFLPWALEQGIAVGARVYNALAWLWEAAEAERCRYAPEQASDVRLRVQIMAGAALCSRNKADFLKFFAEVNRIVRSADPPFRQALLEAALIRIVLVYSPEELANFSSQEIAGIESWLEQKLAWTSLYRFRQVFFKLWRYRRKLFKQALSERTKARIAGDWPRESAASEEIKHLNRMAPKLDQHSSFFLAFTGPLALGAGLLLMSAGIQSILACLVSALWSIAGAISAFRIIPRNYRSLIWTALIYPLIQIVISLPEPDPSSKIKILPAVIVLLIAIPTVIATMCKRSSLSVFDRFLRVQILAILVCSLVFLPTCVSTVILLYFMPGWILSWLHIGSASLPFSWAIALCFILGTIVSTLLSSLKGPSDSESN
jgi:hypothetical protein